MSRVFKDIDKLKFFNFKRFDFQNHKFLIARSSAFMNESTLRIISKVICENDDIFEAKRLFKLSKNDVNVTYKIPSNQWLIALK